MAVLLFRAFSNHCLANAIEPLRAANDLSGKTLYRWSHLSLDGQPVTSSSGLLVGVDGALAAATSGDYLFVMPSYDFRLHATASGARALRAARRRFGTVVGLDTGSWLLAHAGLLSGRAATIHWDEVTAFAEMYPDVRVSDAHVVHDGDVLSCGGTTTAFDLVLDLIEQHHGPTLRLDVQAMFTHAPPGDARPVSRHLRWDQIPEAGIEIMRRHIETPLPIGKIADHLGITRRTFERSCRDRFGLAPQRLYQAAKLREAKRLVEHSGMSVAEVAARCGYRDASAMTRAFHRAFGVAPSGLRRERRQALRRNPEPSPPGTGRPETTPGH